MISSGFATHQNAEKITLKSVILELIRTQHCDTRLALLLDKIHIVVSKRQYSDEDAYRVWLSDGAVAIQAVFMPDLHPFLTAGDVREGTILVLTRYKLVRAAKYRHKGWVWVLVISDMEVGGFDGRENSGMLLEFRGEEEISTSTMKVEVNQAGKKLGDTTSPEVQIHQRRARKRKPESDHKELSSPKSKLRKSNDTLSSAKPEARPALGERNANHQLRTPTKSIKSQGKLIYGSPQRWLDQIEDGNE